MGLKPCASAIPAICSDLSPFIAYLASGARQVSFIDTQGGPAHFLFEKHTFVANKGDYYDLNDGLPQFQP